MMLYLNIICLYEKIKGLYSNMTLKYDLKAVITVMFFHLFFYIK
jgi:hypothetical protein